MKNIGHSASSFSLFAIWLYWLSPTCILFINVHSTTNPPKEKWETIIYLCSMSDDLQIINGEKAEQYKSLLPQIAALLEGEPDLVANLANITGALKEQFGWLWIGFYLVKGSELVLGPFQGPVACTRIKKGRGVCGSSWEQAKTLIVPDVEKFPGHIACNSQSRSEIVIPLIREGEVLGVLDVDSQRHDEFDQVDQEFLEKITELIKFDDGIKNNFHSR